MQILILFFVFQVCASQKYGIDESIPFRTYRSLVQPFKKPCERIKSHRHEKIENENENEKQTRKPSLE